MNPRTSRLSLFAAAVATLLITGVAFAGSIKFNFGGTPSQATWDGGCNNLNVKSSQVSMSTPGDPFTLRNAAISFTSGPATDGSGMAGSASMFMFGASPAGSITITGCLQGQGIGCAPVTLFTGRFLGGEEVSWSDGEGHFKAMDVSGTLNPALASYLGFQSDFFTGQLGVNMVCRTMASGMCMPGSARMPAGGSMILHGDSAPAVPEPSTLILLGSGLAAVSFGVRLWGRGRN